MDNVKFTETVFSSKGKKGILTPDSNGYYEMVVGALNTYNSAGEYYTAEGALRLFESSSHLMRRISNGALYSELGHPKKDASMSMEQFYNRVISIKETNVCGHISEIKLDFQFGKRNPELNNPDIIAMIAKVKPAGAKANALQLSLENPKENTAFSIRGLTENKLRNGRLERRLTNVITWDLVLEAGVSTSIKAYAPGLEQRISSESYSVKEITDTLIDKNTLKRVITQQNSLVGMESNRDMYNDILRTLNGKPSTNRLSGW